MALTLAALYTANTTNRETDYRLWDGIDAVLDSARVNADDTIYTEKSLPEGEWDTVAMGTVESVLCDTECPKVRAWFTAQGVKF